MNASPQAKPSCTVSLQEVIFIITLSFRQKQMIHLLLQHEHYLPAKQLADAMQLSEKTIYRELQVIEELLHDCGIELHKQTGRGYRLELTAAQRTQLHLNEPPEQAESILSIPSRRIRILAQLLSQAPHETSISRLATQYYISNASIVNDLRFIEDMLEPFELKLVRNQRGTCITGSEADIRKAFMHLINDLILTEPYGAEYAVHERLDHLTVRELKQQFAADDIVFVQSLLEEAEQELHYPIGDPYYINILTHLLILMKRMEHGKLLTGKLNTAQAQSPDERIFRLARRMLLQIEAYRGNRLPEEEIYFIYQYLISSGAGVSLHEHTATELIVQDSPHIPELVQQLIRYFATLSHTSSLDTEQLAHGMLVHFKPMLNRLKYQISIKNPLIQQIKHEFPAVYDRTALAVSLMLEQLHIRHMSEDEIGYLALYFQNALEQQVRHQRVLLVCSSGVGTSHLLKSRIARAFPDWEIVQIVSSSQLAQAMQEMEPSIDLIISTVKLRESEWSVIYVSALFNEDDVKQVTAHILQHARTHEQATSLETHFSRYLNDRHLEIITQDKARAIRRLASKMSGKRQRGSQLTGLQQINLSCGDRISLVAAAASSQPQLGVILTCDAEDRIQSLDWLLCLPDQDTGLQLLTQLADWYHLSDGRQHLLQLSGSHVNSTSFQQRLKEDHYGYHENHQ
ncbi:BglG family transcription antiterminator [Paenibacillus sp. WLX2291]|uniref:BglG family transcription antiterminator n=1 Tax=Paenibacillus sp. WLX2291 TaxID=3296934 RepID=UPI00398445EB